MNSSAENHARLRSRQQIGTPVVLWAWERPENLSFVDPERTGIAFLAGTIGLQGDMVQLSPRHQPLNLPQGAKPITVIRIESVRWPAPSLDANMKRDAASAIMHLAESFKSLQVQIDFDARVSERDFYRGLLEDIRSRLPDTVPISITALASWCMQDGWMSGLPVTEAVPMLFRMGPESRDILRRLEKEGEFREPLCRGSVGISLDEPHAWIPRGKRVYVFSPNAWTEARERTMLQEISRWH
jgi:hypothetical protein